MKLLDRYVLSLFLKNYLISLTVLIGLYVVMDMVFEFDKIVVTDRTGSAAPAGLAGVAAVVGDVADYYFYQCFLIFTQMSGIIPIVAAAFTFLRMSRFNELTATLAAGRPILRMTVPVIVAAVLLNGLVVVDQELVLPRMIPKLVRKHDEIHRSVGRQFQLVPMPVPDHAELLAALYNPDTRSMENLDVVWRDEAGVPVRHLWADAAVWDAAANQWRLANGRFTTGLQPGQVASAEQPQAAYAGISPDDIALYHDRGSGLVELLSTHRINELIARPNSPGVGGLYRIKYLRLAQPMMNLVLLLLTIPTVLTYDPKALKPAATKCLVLTGLAMGSVFVCQQVAGQPPLGAAWVSGWPALMAWVPIFVFLPVAVALMERVRT